MHVLLYRLTEEIEEEVTSPVDPLKLLAGELADYKVQMMYMYSGTPL